MLLFGIPAQLCAQTEPMFGQYVLNNTIINPAQAGANRQNQFGILSRFQWFGFQDAPRTQSAYANLILPKNLGLAVGVYFDRLGPELNQQFQTDLAYHARLSESWRLSVGLRTILSMVRIGLTGIPNTDPGDPLLQEDMKSGLLLNLGAGLLAYNENVFIGASMPRLFHEFAEILVSQIGNHSDDQQILEKMRRQFVLYGGLNTNLTQEISFQPSLLFRTGLGIASQADINAVFNYHEILDFGPVLRTNFISKIKYLESVGFIIGLRFHKDLYFGYSYEYPVNHINIVSIQTHEVTLRWLIDSRHKRQIGSPRYFL